MANGGISYLSRSGTLASRPMSLGPSCEMACTWPLRSAVKANGVSSYATSVAVGYFSRSWISLVVPLSTPMRRLASCSGAVSVPFLAMNCVPEEK